MGLLTLGELSQSSGRSFLKLSRGRARRVSRPTRGRGLSGLGQEGECGAAPALGPGELSMCCPQIGWVIYDQYQSPYALCERASAKAGTAGDDEPAADDLEGRRRALEERRAALEEERFARQVQTVMLTAQLKSAAAARAQSPAAVAARAAAARAAAAAQERAQAAQTKKYVAYGVAALVGAKILKLF